MTTKGKFRKRELVLAYGSRGRDRSLYWQGCLAGRGRDGGKSRKLRTHIFKRKHKAEHKLQELRLPNNKWRILLQPFY